MGRLTKSDGSGNWTLEDIAWSQLEIGQVITKEVWEKLYAALCKLRDYENTRLTPNEVVRVNDFEQSQAGHLLKKLNEEQAKHSWIPVTERLPENDAFVLLSFENFPLPMIGRYEFDEDGGGAWYLGDCDEYDTCVANDLFVNAWRLLPEKYEETCD